eukprot:TRINITY_DN92409_c0_g1_i1.p1 TRINITY_DN92409_c0_g1~~TRINITY_DN92409_c0_g1_i1.p1  ORF type:complete len:514 (-),score=147.09 TRINITY_DN92409_c0_g1_i1:185-1726(-)
MIGRVRTEMEYCKEEMQVAQQTSIKASVDFDGCSESDDGSTTLSSSGGSSHGRLSSTGEQLRARGSSSGQSTTLYHTKNTFIEVGSTEIPDDEDTPWLPINRRGGRSRAFSDSEIGYTGDYCTEGGNSARCSITSNASSSSSSREAAEPTTPVEPATEPAGKQDDPSQQGSQADQTWTAMLMGAEAWRRGNCSSNVTAADNNQNFAPQQPPAQPSSIDRSMSVQAQLEQLSFMQQQQQPQFQQQPSGSNGGSWQWSDAVSMGQTPCAQAMWFCGGQLVPCDVYVAVTADQMEAQAQMYRAQAQQIIQQRSSGSSKKKADHGKAERESTAAESKESKRASASSTSSARQEEVSVEAFPEKPTTVMMRHLPNDYTRDMLCDLLDCEGFKRMYDFVYLPIDFNRCAGLGYAFVNFAVHEDADRARKHFEGFTRWRVQSHKVCEVNWGEPLQGLAAHIERFRNSPVMHEGVPHEYKPALFENGVRVPFPEPTKRIRAPRLKHRPAAGDYGRFGSAAA